MQTEQYKKYMRSPEWQKKRQERIAIDNYECVMCHRPVSKMKKVDVHHITYRNLTNENVLDDLVTLCPTCHQRLHNYYNRRRGYKEPSTTHIHNLIKRS